MEFVRELVRWFIWGNRKNTLISEPISVVEETVQEPENRVEKEPVPTSTFDFLKENDSHGFLQELQSLRPVSEQFDRAREDLLRELQRLAPAKKRLLQILKKAA